MSRLEWSVQSCWPAKTSHSVAVKISRWYEEAVRMQGELNNIFKMIERIQAVDTDGVEPMPHPHDGSQRLREDIVREVNDRENNMKNAPEQADGHFLVPQVIE